MLSLQSHHITDLYVWVDDLLPKQGYPLGGRPPLLTDSELVTALIWNALVLRQKTLKDLHRWLLLYHTQDFPQLPKYKGFVAQYHRLLPVCLTLLQHVLCTQQPLRFMDSTTVPVCKRQRADQHRVAKRIAAFGKNHQDYLLRHPHLIPDSWKVDENGDTRYIYFWDTIYRRSDGRLCVRCLAFRGGHWGADCDWLGSDWDRHCPAAVRAS